MSRSSSRSEFEHLLSRFFSHYDLWLQSATIGSTLQRLDSEPDGPRDEMHVRRDGDRWERQQIESVSYMVAVASQFPLPPLPEFSLLNDREAKELTTPLRVEIAKLQDRIAYTEQSRAWRAILRYRAFRAALSRRAHQ